MPARGSRTNRPIMVLLDVLGRRWTLRILWELRESALTFRALREACDEVSPSVLNQRLAELKALELIEASPDGYQLTAQGQTLGAHLLELDGWARRWLKAR
jgi:DNA-binding HxlR family transcriptional regulator